MLVYAEGCRICEKEVELVASAEEQKALAEI